MPNTRSIQSRQQGVSSVLSAAEMADKFSELIRAKLTDNTRTSYASDMRDFVRFCESIDADPLPAAPETLAAYIATRAGVLKVSTIRRRIVGIGEAHRSAGYPSPAEHQRIKDAVSGLIQKYGEPPAKKKAATLDIVRQMLDSLPPNDGTPAGDRRLIRDKAVILLGYAGGFRRSEVARLRVEDVSFETKGIRVKLLSSKTDKARKGRFVGIGSWSGEYCPVQAVRDWLDAAGIQSGPIFRGIYNDGRLYDTAIDGQSIALIWKRAARAAGMNAAEFSGHSARSGHITEAYKRGISESRIARTTGHTSTFILRSYEENANAFDGSSSQVGM